MKLLFVLSVLLVLTTSTLLGATTIEWWQFWTDPDVKPVIEAMVAEFEAANPDIEVKLTDLTWSNGHEKIVIAFASGTGPDVVELGSDWIAQFADNDRLADLSSGIAPDSGEYQGWSMATYRDRVYAHPWILGTRVLYVNRDLIVRAGYDEVFVPISWPDLKAAAYKIDSLDEDIYGWGSNVAEKHRLYKKFLPFFWSSGATIISDDDNRFCLVSSMAAIEALTFYKELHDSCGFIANQRGLDDTFLDGKIGFIISGDWLLKRVKLENRKIDLVSTLIPGPKFPGKSFMGGEFLAINADSEHKDAAMKLIKFVTLPENQVRFCKASYMANPSSRLAQEDAHFSDNPHLQTFIKQLWSAKHPPVDPNWVYMETALEEAVEDALFGSGLIAEPLRQARHKIEKLRK